MNGSAPPGSPVILIANDQEWSARSIESILAPEGYEVRRAYTGTQALELARGIQPDLLILDTQLPDISGPDVCRAIRADPRIGPSTPVILTTAGQAARAQRLEAYRAGAWEFYGQPLDGELLLLRVRVFIDAKLSTNRLRNAAWQDPVSGLYNPQGMAQRAVELGADARRGRAALACVVFVVDDAEATAGVERADALASRVAHGLKQISRGSDVIARLGPLRFGIVAPATSAEGANILARRLVSHRPGASGRDGDDLSIRAGVFAVNDFAGSGLDILDMLERAGASAAEATDEQPIRSTASSTIG